MNEYFLLISIFLPLFLSPIHIFLHTKIPRINAAIFLTYPILTTSLLTQIFLEHSLDSHIIEFAFAPSLRVNLRFIVDGLSLFFGLLISFMGILVFAYSLFYLGIKKTRIGFFQTYLVFFLGAMIGCVFSDNWVLLFVFWEAVSVISFLLIGFDYGKKEARTGARMALLVTGSTALVMLVGILVVSSLTGTLNWSQMDPASLKGAAGTNIGLLCLLIGAFGKSAQFPFHFWLPRAMAAPTPVSVYLHSATMVKLGVFLIARLFPLFESNPLWNPLLIYSGFFTMFLGALFSLLSHHLKAILAYATISQLGFFVGVYGLGEERGVAYDYIHILNHALYKGALFMLVGIIIKKVGHSDIRTMGNLFKYMKVTAFLFLVGLLVMSGLPGTTGFLSKELIFYQIFQIEGHQEKLYFILIVVLASKIFKLAISGRLFFHLFLRKDPAPLFLMKKKFGLALVPATFLLIISFYFGLFPFELEKLTDKFFVSGLHQGASYHLPSQEEPPYNLLTFLVFGLGTLLFIVLEFTGWFWLKIPKILRMDNFFDRNYNLILSLSQTITHLTQPRKPSWMLAWTFLMFASSTLWFIFNGDFLYHPFEEIKQIENAPLFSIARLESWFVILITFLFLIGIHFFESRTSQLIFVTLVGVTIIFFFVVYQAPDLALTQIITELFIFLMFLLLLRTPPNFFFKLHGSRLWSCFRFSIAFLSALAVAFLLFQAKLTPRHPNIGDYYKSHSEKAADRKNIVNTILVDFRGFDTLGEITVILVAFSGAYAIIRKKRELEADGI